MILCMLMELTNTMQLGKGALDNVFGRSCFNQSIGEHYGIFWVLFCQKSDSKDKTGLWFACEMTFVMAKASTEIHRCENPCLNPN